MSNTYTITSGVGVEGFPFDGEWESAGAGYAGGQIGDLETTGTITSNTFNGTDILAIGVVTGSGYDGNSIPSPVFCVVMPPGTPQNIFEYITVQLDSACTSPSTFYSANADLFTQQPASGPASANWVWEIPSASALFVHNENTNITINALPAAMTLDAEPESDSSIYLTWTDSQNTAVFFNLTRDGTLIQQFANTFFAYTDTGLSADTTYAYEITGVDGSNNAVYQPADASATTEAPPMPVDVSFLSAFNGNQFFTANGDLNIGGTVLTLFEGTTTPCNTYTDVTGTVLNSNPLEIDGNGFLDTEIWAPTGQNTRIQVYDATGTLLQDKDNIPGVPYVPGSTGTIYVIDSIYSTDTANAASANAANWVYKIANGAYGAANTVANSVIAVSANLANVSSNSVNFYGNGTFVANGNTINFLNTSFANVSVVANGTNAVNVSFSQNTSVSGNTSNSHVTLPGGIILQWAFYSHTVAGEAGPNVDDFPFSFPNACLGAQLTTAGGPGAAPLVLDAVTRTAFTWYTGYGGADSTGQYVFAYGY